MSIGRDMVYKVYTDNDGDEYSVKVPKWQGDLAGLGFGAIDLTKPLLPRGMRMRGLNLMDPATKAKRIVHVGISSATLWDDWSSDVTVPFEGDADGVAMKPQSQIPEKPKIKAHVIVNY